MSNVFGPSSADGDAEGVGGLSVTGRGRGGGGRPEGLVEDTQVDRAEAHRWDSSEQAESEPSMEPPADRAPAPTPRRAQRMRIPRRRPAAVAPSSHGGRGTVARAEAKKKTAVAITGKLAKVHAQLGRGKVQEALSQARAWTGSEPGDVLAWVALGEAAEAAQDPELALRAYGSIIDLFPSRADLRRYAGQRLERLARSEAALQLAIDTYRKARAQRPDHPASHRLLAYALIRNGQPEQAFHVLREGADRSYPPGRFRGVPRIFGEDLALIAAAWKRAEPGEADAVDAQLKALGVSAETEPSVRFVLYWETDANDVDFHIHDGRGGHAYYSDPELPSGGELYADVTTGYGPECFTIRGPAKGRAYPYRMEAHYYRRGPMGYGMGMLQVLEHDGAGALRVESRPFVVMNDGAYLDLGSLSGPLSNK